MNNIIGSKIVGLLMLVTFLVGCITPVLTSTPTPTTIPTPVPTSTALLQGREPAALAKVSETGAGFNILASALIASWNSRDAGSVRAIFTEDAVAQDNSNSDIATGPDAIASLIASVASFGPNWQARITRQYIGVGDGLVVDEYWDLNLSGHQFTRADPVVEVDWLKIREDRIAAWTLFYSFDTFEKVGGASQTRFDQVEALLSTYQTAWSSGNLQAVAALYSGDAVREETLFGESQTGRTEIASFAKKFFGWYPQVQWTLNLAFGEGHGDNPVTGGTYDIRVNDLSGQPCDVQAAVLLWTVENQISREIIYYEPASLVKCGWAR